MVGEAGGWNQTGWLSRVRLADRKGRPSSRKAVHHCAAQDRRGVQRSGRPYSHTAQVQRPVCAAAPHLAASSACSLLSDSCSWPAEGGEGERTHSL